jgi:hypothetical protein
MHSLKVRRHKVGISPCYLQRGMPGHLLQMKHGPAAPQIVHRERVAEWVKGATWRRGA